MNPNEKTPKKTPNFFCEKCTFCNENIQFSNQYNRILAIMPLTLARNDSRSAIHQQSHHLALLTKKAAAVQKSACECQPSIATSIGRGTSSGNNPHSG
jgi:hypothetical protein